MVKKERIKSPIQVLKEQKSIAKFNRDYGRYNFKSSKVGRTLRAFSQIRQQNRNAGGFPTAPVIRRTPQYVKSYSKGRPRGTYDLRYKPYGGVYGFRKFQAQQLRERRMQLERSMSLSPQQQEALKQYEERQNAMRINPENRVIPSTNGVVRMKSIFDEIDAAANIFP